MNEGSPEQLLAALRFKVMDFKGSLSAPSCVFSRGSSSEQLMYIKVEDWIFSPLETFENATI